MLLDKMQQWMKNGCRMDWLIDPLEQKAYIYQPDHIQEINGFTTILSGNDILPGFELDLARLT